MSGEASASDAPIAVAQVDRLDGPDRAAVLSLVQEVSTGPPYDYAPGQVSPAQQWFPELVARGQLLLIARRAGQPVGYCACLWLPSYGHLDDLAPRLTATPATTMYLAELGVAPSVRRHPVSRRRGVGRRLVQAALAAAPPQTTGWLVRTLVGHRAAIALYEQLGFTPVPGVRQRWNGRERLFLSRRA